ncbi:MAG: hypothetical protein JNM06_21895 [Blastocatellia bacterium]|nr:hypothetical protein [Blastocatellia bacterium]
MRIARGYDHFIELVEQALKENDLAAKTQRQATVVNSTWDVRTEQVCTLIEEKLQASKK